VQESLATSQARRAKQAEFRAKASETKALARERGTKRALRQLRKSQQKRQASPPPNSNASGPIRGQ
jgi:hypothetical protein